MIIDFRMVPPISLYMDPEQAMHPSKQLFTWIYGKI